MLVVSSLREDYNGLKSTITACQLPAAFSELHAHLSNHNYMLGKTRASNPSIAHAFTTTTGTIGSSLGPSPTTPLQQPQLSAVQQQLAALGFQIVSIASPGSQAFYGYRQPMNNNSGNRRCEISCGNNNRGRGDTSQFS